MDDRWHIIIGWMPQIPNYADLTHSRIPAVAYAQCLGYGVTRQFPATEHQWTPEAAVEQFRWLQEQECPDVTMTRRRPLCPSLTP